MRPRVAALRQQIVLNAVTSSSGRASSSESVRTLASAAQATHASGTPARTVHQEDDAASRSNRPADDALDAVVSASRIARATLGKQSCRSDAQWPTSAATDAALRNTWSATCGSEHTAIAHRPSQLLRCAQRTQLRTATVPSSLAPQQSMPSASAPLPASTSAISSVFTLLLRSNTHDEQCSTPTSPGRTPHRRISRSVTVSAIDTVSSSSPHALYCSASAGRCTASMAIALVQWRGAYTSSAYT